MVGVNEMTSGEGNRVWISFHIQTQQMIVIAVAKICQRERRDHFTAAVTLFERQLIQQAFGITRLFAIGSFHATRPNCANNLRCPLRTAISTAASSASYFTKLPLFLWNDLSQYQSRTREQGRNIYFGRFEIDSLIDGK